MKNGLMDVGGLLLSVFQSEPGGLNDVSDDLKNAKGAVTDLIPQIGVLKEVVITASAVMGIALFAAFAPITATITAILGLITMMEQLKNLQRLLQRGGEAESTRGQPR